MPDKTKKELCEIITELEKKNERLTERLDKQTLQCADLYNNAHNATDKLEKFKEMARDQFISRARVIGNLTNIIQGITERAANVDCLIQTGQMPKFLDE